MVEERETIIKDQCMWLHNNAVQISESNLSNQKQIKNIVTLLLLLLLLLLSLTKNDKSRGRGGRGKRWFWQVVVMDGIVLLYSVGAKQNLVGVSLFGYILI